jgi:hypothetical protein
MACLGKDKTRLPALDVEAVCKQRGIIVTRIWRIGVDLGVKSMQLVGVRGGLHSIEQLKR